MSRYRGFAFVDWDDTLGENMRYFREAERINALRLGALLGLPLEAVARHGAANDVKVAQAMGLGRDSFPTAWIRTYHELCAQTGARPDAKVEEELVQTCATAYDYPIRLLDGAETFLRWLRHEGYEVTIWTAGSHEVQERKINESGLGHLIDRRQVVLRKTPATLAAALAGRAPDRTFVVGNSLHSDVAPALAIGVLALHLDGESWGLDQVDVDRSHPLYRRVTHLQDVPPILAVDSPGRRAY